MTFLPVHYLFKGRIAHIVADSLTIYSVVQTSPSIILQCRRITITARVTLLAEIMI